ncbi:hypothetical protein GOP47_0025758 [Adiantum capillus-veneris]|uniref:RRM domain-containing protein n=1 Tax=Adiantum capillus-veneris TaxID=13818 RepID=A0A9D4Z379_ADICA|nr:hypothetical protein GOP47_0025758 [Adiantum capillus-veneris]
MAEIDTGMYESPLNMSLDDIIASNKRIADAANRTHHITPHRLGSSRSRSRSHSHSHKLRRNPSSNGGHRGQSPGGRQESPGRRSAKTPRERWESPGGKRSKTPRGRQESPGGRSWKVYVSNVGPDVSESMLKKHFSKVGKVLDCSLHFDRDGEHQGTALVEFSSERGAHAAMDEFQGVLFYGAPLHLVVLAQ